MSDEEIERQEEDPLSYVNTGRKIPLTASGTAHVEDVQLLQIERGSQIIQQARAMRGN